MTLKKTLLGLMTSTAIGGFGGVAMAQSDGAAANDDVDTIVVVSTARGRPEAAQDVPISGTIFNSDALEDARITNVDGFVQLTPGVTFAKTQGPGTGFLTIRGLTQVRNSEAPVATVVDGVLQTNNLQFTQEFFDIESIEVLRGPQGALYGRNAVGGAIIINTKGPTNEFEGFVQAGYASGGEYSVAGSISGPIVKDTLLIRLAARFLDRDGYFDNLTLGTKADPFDDFTFRGHLRWNVADNVTADLKGSVVRSSGSSLNFANQFAPVNPATGLADGSLFAGVDSNTVFNTFFQNNLSNTDRNLSQISLRLSADLGFATFTSATAYDTVSNTLVGDASPYDAALGFGAGNHTDVETISQEVRLTSAGDEKLDWIVGAYYLATNRFRADHTTVDTGAGLLPLTFLPTTDASNPSTGFLASDNNNRAWALFANFDYEITDWLELYFGIRYDKDNRDRFTSPLVTSGLPTGCAFATPDACLDTASFDAFQPKVTLTAKPFDNLTAYASWGKGFRSGQYNNSGTAAAAALLTPPLVGVLDLVPQEDTSTFEIGFKSSLLDERVTFNAAAFHSTVEGQHYFEFVAALNAQIIASLDEVELKGFEVEARANLMDGLDAYASYSYTDSEITEYALNPADVGNVAPYVPQSTLNAGVQYRTALSDFLGVFARVDYERRGEQFWGTNNAAPRDPLNLLNARLGIEDPDGAWTLTGGVENATNLIYNSEYTGGFSHAGIPRVYRVDLRVNF